MIRNDGRWQMSPRLGESDGLVFLFQVYLTASQKMAASGSNSESAGGVVEGAGNPSTALIWKALFRETKG
jgi:hypothetical protein